MDGFEVPAIIEMELVAWADIPRVRASIERRVRDGLFMSWVVVDGGMAMGLTADTVEQAIADVVTSVPADSWQRPRHDLFTSLTTAGKSFDLPLRFHDRTTHHLRSTTWAAHVVEIEPGRFVTRVWDLGPAPPACVELPALGAADECRAAFSAMTGVPEHLWKPMPLSAHPHDDEVAKLRQQFAHLLLMRGEQTELYVETQLVLLGQLAIKGDWASVLEGAGMLSGQSYPRLRMGTRYRQHEAAGVAEMKNFFHAIDAGSVERVRDTCLAGAVLSPSKQLWYALYPRNDVFLRVLILVEHAVMLVEWRSPHEPPQVSPVAQLSTRQIWQDAEHWYADAVKGLVDEIYLQALNPAAVSPGRAVFSPDCFGPLLSLFRNCLGILVGDWEGRGPLVFCPHAHLWSFPLSLVHFAARDYFGFRGVLYSASLPMEIAANLPGMDPPPRCGTGKTYLWVDDDADLAAAGELLGMMLGPDRVSDPAEAEAVLILGHGFATRGTPFDGPGRWSMQAMTSSRHMRHQLVVLASCYGGAPIAAAATGDYEAADSWIGALGAHAVIASPWPIPTWLGALACAYSWLAWRGGSAVELALFSWLQEVAQGRDDQWPRRHAPAGFSDERRQAVQEIASTWRAQATAMGEAAQLAWAHLRLLRTWG